jgi:hypothetical protein
VAQFLEYRPQYLMVPRVFTRQCSHFARLCYKIRPFVSSCQSVFRLHSAIAHSIILLWNASEIV